MLYQSQSASHGMCSTVSVQLSNNGWFSSWQSVLMWRRRSTTKDDFIKWKKNHFWRRDFVLFSKLFPCFGEHCVVCKLSQIHATKYMQAYMYIYIVFNSHTIYFCPNQTWNFVTNIFSYQLFPKITGHGIKKGLLVKCEILGLVFGWCTIENYAHFDLMFRPLQQRLFVI